MSHLSASETYTAQDYLRWKGNPLTHASDLVFEIILPKPPRRGEVAKFNLCRNVDVANFRGETQRSGLSRCGFDFDFGRLWKRKGGNQA